MKITMVIAALFMMSSCGGNNSAAKKTENSTCVDSTRQEMFDEHGKAYYVWVPCDSLKN